MIKKLKRNLLATASAITLLSSANSAFAAVYLVTGGAGDLNLGTNVKKSDGNAAGGAISNTESNTIYLNDNVTNNLAGSYVQSLDVYGYAAGRTITVGAASGASPISIINNYGSSTVAAVTAANGATPIVSGNSATSGSTIAFSNTNGQAVYSGLEFINKIDFSNKAATLTIGNSGATASTSIGKMTNVDLQSTGGANGNLVFAQSAELSTAVVKVADLTKLTVNDGVTLTLSGATDFVGTKKFTSGIEVAGAGKIIAKGTSTLGNVTLLGAGSLTIDTGAKAGTVTATASTGNTITLTGGEATTIDTKGTVVASGISIITNLTLSDASATATLSDSAKILTKATFGAKATLTAGSGTLIVDSDTSSAGGTFNLAGATLTKLTTDSSNNTTINVTADSTITEVVNTLGKLNISAGKKVLLGAKDISVDSVTLSGSGVNGEIRFGGDKTLTVTGKTFNADIYTPITQGTVAFENQVTPGKIYSDTIATVKLVSLTKSTSDVTFGNNLINVSELKLTHADSKASASFVGNAAMKITSSNGGSGALTLVNDAQDIVVLSVGASGAQLKSLVLNGSKGLVTGDLYTDALSFKKDSIVKATNISNISAVTTTTNGTGSLHFVTSSTLAANIGTSSQSIKELKYLGLGTATLNLNSKQTYGAHIKALTPDALTVSNVGTNSASTEFAQLGDPLGRLAAVSFGATSSYTTTLNGKVYAKALTAANASNITFKNSVYGGKLASKVDSTFTLGDNSAIVTFADGAGLVDIDVVATTAGNGQLVFSGNNSLGKVGTSTTSIGKVTFSDSATSKTKINDSIYTTNGVTFGSGEYVVTSDATIGGASTSNAGAVFNIGPHALTFNNSLTTAGATTLKFDLDSDGKVAGKFVSTGSTATVTASNLTVDMSGAKVFAKDGSTSEDVIFAKDIGTNASSVTYTSGNGFVKWSGIQGSSSDYISLVAAHDAKGFKSTLGSSATFSTAASSLFDSVSAATSGAALDLLELVTTLSPSKAVEALERVAAPWSTDTTLASIADNASSVVSDRLAGISAASGVSSGAEDEALDIGVWTQGFGSGSTKKLKSNESGYNGTTVGGTLGADYLISDYSLIGLAVTQSGSTVKYKDTKSGDKSKQKNTFFSVYGKVDYQDNMFVKGNLAFGSGTVKDQTKKVASDTQYEIATAKYDTMSYNFELLFGRKFKIAEDTAFVPMFGGKYSRQNSGGYTETGSSYNLTVTTRATDKTYAILGTALENKTQLQNLDLVSEAHVYGYYDLHDKKSGATAKLDGMTSTIDLAPSKSKKGSLNFGLGVDAKAGLVEYGVGYDARLAEKFVSHQGTLRVRINL
ncbi:MAG: autotransporter domain-containing protein [Rickettsiaceae bacterium]|nr:autotransporter domain-containing protein [Rickettsiaceae bacterium]